MEKSYQPRKSSQIRTILPTSLNFYWKLLPSSKILSNPKIPQPLWTSIEKSSRIRKSSQLLRISTEKSPQLRNSPTFENPPNFFDWLLKSPPNFENPPKSEIPFNFFEFPLEKSSQVPKASQRRKPSHLLWIFIENSSRLRKSSQNQKIRPTSLNFYWKIFSTSKISPHSKILPMSLNFYWKSSLNFENSSKSENPLNYVELLSTALPKPETPPRFENPCQLFCSSMVKSSQLRKLLPNSKTLPTSLNFYWKILPTPLISLSFANLILGTHR